MNTSTKIRLILKTAVFSIMTAAAFFSNSQAQQNTETKPKGHIELSDPADLTKQQAENIYVSVLPIINDIFAMSDIGSAVRFTSWKRYNTAPYISATHGARYVSNYANSVASGYGQLKRGETYPKGAILAKDSFSVTSDRKVYPGALFLMEKMAKGFNKPSGDWKYTMVLPDGSVFGATNGENSENVEFCIGCHAAKASLDHIFFVPEEYLNQN
jgi:Cytochrome P460